MEHLIVLNVYHRVDTEQQAHSQRTFWHVTGQKNTGMNNTARDGYIWWCFFSFRVMAGVTLSWLIASTEQMHWTEHEHNGAIVNATRDICAPPAPTNQKACCEKGLFVCKVSAENLICWVFPGLFLCEFGTKKGETDFIIKATLCKSWQCDTPHRF